MTAPILNLSDIPEADKDPEFWGIITSPHYTRVMSFMLINEVRKYDPETLSEPACRTQLAKIKAIQEIMDFPNALINGGEDKEISDELPEH